MITPADAYLHAPAAADWAETNFFTFQIPEVGMTGGVYALFRAQHGIALSTVHLNSRRVTAHWEAEYCDLQAHLPMGAEFDLLDYQLANGLSVRAVEPNKIWEVDYDDGEGAGIHFAFSALMPPYDIHDPAMDPMVASRSDGHDYAWGTAYAGHFDMSGLYEGEVELGDRRIPFRTVGTMDHSWGPRPERHRTTLSWLNAHFSDDLVIHALCDFDAASGGTELRFTHGYLLTDGELVGLAGGKGTTRRQGWFPEEILLEVRDPAGREWTLHGEARTSFPWYMWPDAVAFNALVEWDLAGRSGFGQAYDCIGLYDLTAGGLGAERAGVGSTSGV